MPFDFLSQPFCWLTFSHWITNSVNCVRTSHTNEKQGTAALFASQKPGCLQWFQTQPSSSRASPCIARTERKSSQGKAEVGSFVSISTTRGVMKGTYTLLNPSAPLIWNFIHCKTFRCKFTVKYWQLGCQPLTLFLQDYYCTQHLQLCTVFTKYSIILLYNIFYSIRLCYLQGIL